MTPRRPGKQGVYCPWGAPGASGLVGRPHARVARGAHLGTSHWQTRSVYARPATRLLACLHGSAAQPRFALLLMHTTGSERTARERHWQRHSWDVPRLSTVTSQGSTPSHARPTNTRSTLRYRSHGHGFAQHTDSRSRPLGRPCTKLATMPQRFVHEGRAGAALGQTLIADRPRLAPAHGPSAHTPLGPFQRVRLQREGPWHKTSAAMTPCFSCKFVFFKLGLKKQTWLPGWAGFIYEYLDQPKLSTRRIESPHPCGWVREHRATLRRLRRGIFRPCQTLEPGMDLVEDVVHRQRRTDISPMPNAQWQCPSPRMFGSSCSWV